MNKDIANKAVEAITKAAQDMTTQQKEHFASVLTLLATCYGKDATFGGVLILSDGAKSVLVGINANEFEVAGLVSEAHELIVNDIKAEAPEHGMYN
jgi:hypothetical protein